MKSAVCMALGLVFAASLGYSQDPPKMGAEGEKKCDLTKVENRTYCKGCDAFPTDAEVEKGACKKCKTKVEQVATCVKKAYPCRAHGDSEVVHSKRCCKPEVKDCCKETTILARIEYRCDACHARGLTEKEVRHSSEKCEGKIAKTCEKSGTFPHGGEESKVEGTPKPADAPK